MKNVKRFLVSLLSRKLILAVAGAVVAFGNSFWDWGLTNEQVMAVLIPLLAFVGVEAIRDIKSTK